MIDTSVRIGNYRLTWNAPIAGYRELYFPTFTHLQKYYTSNAQYFSCPCKMWVWTGKLYERFVFLNGRVVPKSRLEHLLKSISD